MKSKKSTGLLSQAGQVSRLLLVLAVIVLVAAIITYLVMRMAEKPPKVPTPDTSTVVQPIYEQTLGNIRFVFESALDKGNALRVAEITNTQSASYQQKDLFVSNTGAKFIKVTVGAQNVGTLNTEQGSWTIDNIVDSKGREFIPVDSYTITPWLSNPDFCGTLLKPAFDPTPCTKIYEVSKESTGLKIRVETGIDNTASNLSSGKIASFLLDLIVK